MDLVQYLLITCVAGIIGLIVSGVRRSNNQLPEDFKIKDISRIKENELKQNIVRRIVIEIKHDSLNNRYILCGKDLKFNFIYYLKTWTGDKEIVFEHTDKYVKTYDSYDEALKHAEHARRLIRQYLQDCEILKISFKEKYKTIDYLYIDDEKNNNTH